MPSVRLIQITDCHLFSQPSTAFSHGNPYDKLKRSIKKIEESEEGVDAIFLTGDLSHDQSERSYHHLYTFFEPLNVDVFWIIGNHDHPEIASRVLKRAPFRSDDRVQFPGWDIIFLNAAPVDEAGNAVISEKEIERIQALLSRTNQSHVLVFCHYNLISDEVNAILPWVKNADMMLNVLAKASRVKIVSWGHVHQSASYQHLGMQCLSTPGTGIESKRPNGVRPDVGPGYRSFTLYPSGRFQTKVHRA